MKAKFSGMGVVGGSGKLGGHVVTRNRQGYAVRTKVTPINRRTNTQQGVRSSFTANSQGWRGITAAQRLAWIAAAADFKKSNIWGDQYIPSGKNLYATLNNTLASVGVAAISDPPLPVSVPALTALASLVLTSAAATVTFAPTPVPAGYALQIFATRGLSPGVAFAKNQFRFVKKLAAATATGASFFTEYSAIFGAPITGKKVFVKAFLVNITTGQRGIPLQYSAIVA